MHPLKAIVPRKCFLSREDVDNGARALATVEIYLAFRTKTDNAGDAREKCVVLAHADVLAGKYRGTALADDDRAGFCHLSCVEFCSEVFRI